MLLIQHKTPLKRELFQQVSLRRAQAQDEARAASMQIKSSTSPGPEIARPHDLPWESRKRKEPPGLHRFLPEGSPGFGIPLPTPSPILHRHFQHRDSTEDRDDSTKDRISVTGDMSEMSADEDMAKVGTPKAEKVETGSPTPVIQRIIRTASRHSSRSPPDFHGRHPPAHRLRLPSREAQDMSVGSALRHLRHPSTETWPGLAHSVSSMSSANSGTPTTTSLSSAAPPHAALAIVTSESGIPPGRPGPKIYPNFGECFIFYNFEIYLVSKRAMAV